MATKKVQAGGKMGTGTKVGVGIAIAGALSAAGYYFYGSSSAKKHRQIAAGWANKLKADVVKEARALKIVEEKSLAAIIDGAAKTYQSMSNLKKEDVTKAVSELKSNWKKIKAELATETKKVATVGKKVIQKAKKGL